MVFRLLLIRFCVIAGLFALSEGLLQETHAQDLPPLGVEAVFAERTSVGREEPLVLTLSRPVTPEDGRLAVVLGTTDLTALIETSGTTVRYVPDLLPLPPGDTELSVHLVGPEGGWQEVTRFPLRVRRAGNLETLAVTPDLTLNNKGQVAEGTVPAPDEALPHRIYQDFSGQLALRGAVAHPDWQVQAEMNVVGASYEEEALRFGERGADAPPIDLSDYRVQMSSGPAHLTLGHLSHGRHPYLINSFSSRGLMAHGDLDGRADVSVAVANGSRIVGWGDPLGLDDAGHRIVSSTVGVDLLKRAQTLRIELSYLDGSVRPRSSFNAGQILDAEKSRGAGVHLTAHVANQRVRLEGNVAGSRFTNPDDPELAQAADLVPVEETTRYAHSLDVSVDVLRNVALTPAWPVQLSVSARRERVDPLYRTVAAYVQADQLQHAADLQLSVGPVSVQGGHTRTVDNLDDIPSILTTKSRQNTLNANVPTASLLGASASGVGAILLPRLTYSYNWTHQFGASLPVDGGFDPSHLPDQVSRLHGASAGWQYGMWRVGYRLGYAVQDNRQTGRAEADFVTWTHSGSLGTTLFQIWYVNLDIGLERAESLETGRIDITERIGAQMTLRPVEGLTLSASVSPTWMEDKIKTSIRSNTNLALEGSYGFQFRDGSRLPVRGQVFVRYARQSSQTRDVTFDLDTENRTWTVNTGVSLSIF